MLNFYSNRQPNIFLATAANRYSPKLISGMRTNVLECRITSMELRLQCLFSTLLSSGWGLVGGTSAALVGSYRTIFSQLPRFSGHPRAMGSCVTGSSRYSTYRGGTAALTIAPRLQWLNWSNLCLFFLSTQFYSLPVLGLSRVVHKTTISYFNWLSLGGDVSTPLWRRIHVLCFLKHAELARADQSVLLFRRIGVALLVLVNVAFHYNIATRSLTANMPTVGLTDMLIEPWILWYPLFCDGGNPTNQLLFVSCLMYWRYWALSNRPI